MDDDFEYEDEEGEWDDYETNHQRYRQRQIDLHKQRTLYEAYVNSKRDPVHMLMNRCVRPVFSEPQISGQLLELVAFCLLINFMSTLRFLPKFTVPLSSAVFGSLIVIRWFESLSYSLFAFAALAYLSMLFVHTLFGGNCSTRRRAHLGIISIIYCFMWTCLLQHFLLTPRQFTRIRGSLMIMAMKLISLAFDLDKSSSCSDKETSDSIDGDVSDLNSKIKNGTGASKKFDHKLPEIPPKNEHDHRNNMQITGGHHVTRFPTLLEYASYLINPASVSFGPWYSFSQHKIFMEQKDFRKILLPVAKGFLCTILSLTFLVCSTCIFEWLILDGYEYFSKTLIGYRDAASYRFSHYFVSFLSEATILLSGNVLMTSSGSSMTSSFGGLKGFFESRVTRPFSIELPRSLTVVVVNWNIPMHNWLKNYAFRPSLRFGKFFAILVTYLASSGLHGFNLQLSAVLLSLGFYTYGEYVMREKLAKSFNACIRARNCQPNCNHKYKKWNFCVLVVNLVFSLLSVYHLIYLGMVFDSSNEQDKGYSIKHTMAKWQEYNYASLYIACGTLALAVLI